MRAESEKEERVSTSIKINPDLWKEAKIVAIEVDITVSELVERALKRELERIRKESEKYG